MEAKTGKLTPFEKKAKVFENMVHAIALGVGGEEEYDIRRLGGLIVELRGIKSDEERDKFKEEKISPMYDKLGAAGKTNPKVGEAIVNIVTAEMMLG